MKINNMVIHEKIIRELMYFHGYTREEAIKLLKDFVKSNERSSIL